MSASISTSDRNFRRVLEDFKATLSQDDKDDFKLSTLDDLKLEILAIQEEQATERKMKNSARLKSFLEAMEQYDEVVKVFLNTSEILAFVWVANTFADAFDALLDAYQDIGESIPLFAQYESLFKNNPYMYTVLELIYVDILEFHRKALGYFKQRMWKQLFHATWKTFRTKFSGILANLRRHKTLVESQANLIQFTEIQKTRAAAEAQVRSMRKTELRQMRMEVRSWLSSADSDMDHESVAKVRVDYPDTGRWLLKQSQVRAWCDPDSSSIQLLWLNGIPGAGKTVLASLLIDECRKIPTICVAFFYCKYEDPQRNSFVAIARSILLQLLHHKKTLLSYIYEKAFTGGGSSLESLELAQELLKVALMAFDRVYLVIDGLDECRKTEKMLISTWFQSMVNSVSADDPLNLRCLFIGQVDNDTSHLLNAIPTLQITSAHNSEDIANYCKVWAGKIREKFELSSVDTESLVTTVSARADGMFLFARLVMSNFLSQNSRAKLRKEMAPEHFPHGLEQAYARIIHRVFTEAQPSEREDAAKLLGWLVCARRPLKWHEIQGAWSFDSDTQTFDYEERRLRTDSKELCGSLVEIRNGGVIDLVHLTAKFYLLQQKLVLQDAEEFNLTCLCLGYMNLPCFDMGIPDTDIRSAFLQGHYAFTDYAIAYWSEHLERCVQGGQLDNLTSFGTLAGILRVFLSTHHTDTGGRPSTSKAPQQMFQRFSMEDFFRKLIDAVNYASQMKVNSKEVHQTHSLDLADQIARMRSIMEKMAGRSDPKQKHRLHTLYGPNLFKCSRMPCKYFYEGFPSSQERDRHFEKHQRMYFCTYPGCHIALIGFQSGKDLEKHETEYHQKIEDGSTFPWHLPPGSINIGQEVRLGNLAAVETWMEQFEGYIPCNILVKFDTPRGPLNVAIECRNEQIYNILLSRAPESFFSLKSNQGDYHSLMAKTIKSRNEEAVRALLSLAKHVSTVAMYSLVSKALNLKQDTLALTLMEHPDSGLRRLSNGQKWSRRRSSSYLTLAIRHARIAVVRSLVLDHGIQPNHKDSNSRTALTAAAEFGQEEIVEFLLGTGKCTIRAISRGGATAASMAARQGHERIIRLLFPQEPLPKDIEPLLKSAELRNAVIAGDAERVGVLLKQQDIKAGLADTSGYTPLLLAVERGHDSIVKQLLGRADVQINRDNYTFRRNPLHLAIFNGHEAVVRLLLSRKEVGVKDQLYFPSIRMSTDALGIATHLGNEAIIKLLKEHVSVTTPPPTVHATKLPSPISELAKSPAFSSPGSNRELQDYQMELMLLEQQNKRRLLMARREMDALPAGTRQETITNDRQSQPTASPLWSPSPREFAPSSTCSERDVSAEAAEDPDSAIAAASPDAIDWSELASLFSD
ncbi:hypothetical protein FGG08_005600 [Glutinoglossum americanum]|uniref:NACHT domain-containing protein n=1 Tax=Glutinoglossum americanum TaxID=1670608 RepID=A0A9P8I553_9PEZI|nr:hypothetical protein FGG08_005600 [Glutinoglossum americanum]